MKIRVHGDDANVNLILPTNLVFGNIVVKLVNTVGRRYAGEALEKIPPEALERLFAEMRRIKKKHGSWELVDIESADGSIVHITL